MEFVSKSQLPGFSIGGTLVKNRLKFQNRSCNILSKIAFWNKPKCLNKELIIWSGLPRLKGSLFDGAALKNDTFHLQENF